MHPRCAVRDSRSSTVGETLLTLPLPGSDATAATATYRGTMKWSVVMAGAGALLAMGGAFAAAAAVFETAEPSPATGTTPLSVTTRGITDEDLETPTDLTSTPSDAVRPVPTRTPGSPAENTVAPRPSTSRDDDERESPQGESRDEESDESPDNDENGDEHDGDDDDD